MSSRERRRGGRLAPVARLTVRVTLRLCRVYSCSGIVRICLMPLALISGTLRNMTMYEYVYVVRNDYNHRCPFLYVLTGSPESPPLNGSSGTPQPASFEGHGLSEGTTGSSDPAHLQVGRGCHRVEDCRWSAGLGVRSRGPTPSINYLFRMVQRRSLQGDKPVCTEPVLILPGFCECVCPVTRDAVLTDLLCKYPAIYWSSSTSVASFPAGSHRPHTLYV